MLQVGGAEKFSPPLGFQRLSYKRAGVLLGIYAGSASRGGDVTVYVFDINLPSLPVPFDYVLASISVVMAL